ncbi:response regulator transcription factor [Thermoleophilia bacterium SCSIO 60948]|nr:response regulator transcription factor [Thermoleophilia bacterium SCSIO 60948]
MPIPEPSQRPRRILVVDDELNIRELISMALRYAEFEVESAADGASALAASVRFRPDLLVLDVMLPDIDGFEVARRIGQTGEGPRIVFLTARDTTADKIKGLTLGGDDYVTKPFSVEELLARVRAILRRGDAPSDPAPRLVFADLELDEDTREVFRGGRSIELTDTEFRLLRYLMLNPRAALSRAQILDQVWSYDFGGDSRILETYISYLRRKIDSDAAPLIHTVRGVGYSLRQPR